MVHSDIIIIGAGAAGLMAAASAPGSLVLEKMPRPGRKIAITGKGRCNFTNMSPWQDFSTHIHPSANPLKHAFHALTPDALAGLFAENGLPCVVERGNRAFPESHNALDVIDTLVAMAGKSGSKIICSCPVNAVSRRQDGTFILDTPKGEFSCARLIITCGGLSYPSTGSTGDGHRFAASLGHSITRTYPSLTALVPKLYKESPDDGQQRISARHIPRETPLGPLGRQYMGRSMKNVSVTLTIDRQDIVTEFGDLEFTDGGIEGPIGFKLSRRAVVALENGGRVALRIDFKKGEPLAFEIAGYVGWERAVVTAGGVAFGEVVPKTMESRLCPGLYFAGEVLDFDADTGGYNLHLAFATGHLAGINACSGR